MSNPAGAYLAGYAAGLDDEPLSCNPHDVGTFDHGEWTKGHIGGRSKLLHHRGEYGATAEAKAAAARTDRRTLMADPAVEILGAVDVAPPAPSRLDRLSAELDDQPDVDPVRGPGYLPPPSWLDPSRYTAVVNGRSIVMHVNVDVERWRAQARAAAVKMAEAIEQLAKTMATSSDQVARMAEQLAAAAGLDPAAAVDALRQFVDRPLADRVPTATGSLRGSIDPATMRRRHGRSHCPKGHGALAAGGRCRTCERGARR